MVQTWCEHDKGCGPTPIHTCTCTSTRHTHTHTLSLRIRLVKLEWLTFFKHYLHYIVCNSRCLQLEILCLICVNITFLVRFSTPDLVVCMKWWRTTFPPDMTCYLNTAFKPKNLKQADTYMCKRDHRYTQYMYTHHIKAKGGWTTILSRHPCCSVHNLVSVCIFSALHSYLWECNNGFTTPGINIQNLVGCYM